MITTMMRHFIPLVFILSSLISCTNNNDKKNSNINTPEAYVQQLESYMDSIKVYNTNWNNEFTRLRMTGDTAKAQLIDIRNKYQHYIDRTIKEIETLDEKGAYAKELKITYYEFFNVQKGNLEKYMTQFENLNYTDTSAVKAFITNFETESYELQLSERQALINVQNFTKLFYKENKIEKKETQSSSTHK